MNFQHRLNAIQFDDHPPHRMLEIRHLRSLAALARGGRLNAAADAVHLTPSALTHQMRALERHFDVTLYRRTPQGLKLTPAGERLPRLAESVLAQVDEAQRDLQRLAQDTRGTLRIALECHTCFDWLMPVIDAFRRRWPEVEVDLVAGFHADPVKLLRQGQADLVIDSRSQKHDGLVRWPLFRFEIVALLPLEHRRASRVRLQAHDFAGETLITYPVPEERIDLISRVLAPAGVAVERRTAELTVAILQLVASRRGVAALPSWGVQSYVEHDYVLAKPIGRSGLWSELHAVLPRELAGKAYMRDMAAILREQCARLPAVQPLPADEAG